MKIYFSHVCLMILISIQSIHAQNEEGLFNYWQFYSDIENSLYKHFSTLAFEQLESREKEVELIKTKADWLQRQSKVQKELGQIIGTFPNKTPLKAQITGILKKDGYRVEKIIYESVPGYYVTGALFIPEGVKKKAPAIFYACGHSYEGFRVAIYQHIIINLVKKGFVVFTIDPMGQGERYEYWDIEEDKPRLTPDHEHSYAGAQCLISGYSIARYFIWDAIRGIDYMLTRKEIDPNRIGMTGRSGGGNITAYLGAIDNRILASAPECYITSYEQLYKSKGPQCAEQNLYQMISNGLDHPDFIEARAPKPTLIISTTRDFFSIEGTRDSYKEAQSIYVAMGAEENLNMVEDDDKHTSTKKNREAMYSFFQKELNNPGNPKDFPVEVIDQEELKVTKTGQLLSSFNGETVFSLNKSIVDEQIKKLQRSRNNIEKHLENLPSVAENISGYEAPDNFGKPIFSGRYVKPDYIMEKYLIPGSGDYVLPAILLKPIQSTNKKLVLMMDTEGLENAITKDLLALDLVKNGHTVLVFDLPGIGTMGPGYLKGDSFIEGTSYNQWFAAVLAGKSHVGLRVEDIIRLVHFAKNELKGFSELSAISIGPLGGELLHSASFSADIKSVCLISPFLGYTDVATTRFYKSAYIPFMVAGAIEAYDLSDLIAGLCPRKVVIINPKSGDGTIADKEKTNDAFLFPSRVYEEKSDPENFQLINNINNAEIIKQLISWLE